MTTVADQAQSTSKGGSILDRIREDILLGRRPPGSRLRFAELSRTYGGSAGSLREALQRLADAGLVTAEENRGFTVMSLSADDLEELIESRLVIEVEAFRRAILEGDLAWESEAVAALHQLEHHSRVEPGHPERFAASWAQAHARFHLVLLQGCRNERLRRFAEALRDGAEVYRCWSSPSATASRDSRAEHRQLVEAVVARDVDAGVRLMQQHIRRSIYEPVTPPS